MHKHFQRSTTGKFSWLNRFFHLNYIKNKREIRHIERDPNVSTKWRRIKTRNKKKWKTNTESDVFQPFNQWTDQSAWLNNTDFHLNRLKIFCLYECGVFHWTSVHEMTRHVKPNGFVAVSWKKNPRSHCRLWTGGTRNITVSFQCHPTPMPPATGTVVRSTLATPHGHRPVLSTFNIRYSNLESMNANDRNDTWINKYIWV